MEQLVRPLTVSNVLTPENVKKKKKEQCNIFVHAVQCKKASNAPSKDVHTALLHGATDIFRIFGHTQYKNTNFGTSIQSTLHCSMNNPPPTRLDAPPPPHTHTPTTPPYLPFNLSFIPAELGWFHKTIPDVCCMTVSEGTWAPGFSTRVTTTTTRLT